MSPEHRRLTHALLLSLAIHAFLLSLTFGGQGGWLLGFGFPWQDRRIEVPDLRVVVVPAQITATEPAVTPVAEPLQQAWVEQPVASGPAPMPSVSRAPTQPRTAAAIVPGANPGAEASPKAEANPSAHAATGAAPAQMPFRADRSGDAAPPPIPAPAVIALERTDEPTWLVPPTPMMPAPVIAPSTSTPETAMPSLPDAGDGARDQEARERAVEPAKLDASRQEGQRQAQQLEVARRDAARQEAARAENARLEAAKVEAAKVEAAKIEAAKVEAAKVEAAKVEAPKVEAPKVEAAQVEAAQVEATKIEAAKVEAAKIEAAKVGAAQEAAARREAALRAIGRQLDEEAARREAATAAARLLPSSSSARRYWLFGRTDPNAELILYAEAWSRKIQLNGTTFDMVREAAKQPHTDPLVTVAIRSDGSVESVTFVLSSGVAAIDEAIRRVVDSQRPYQVFPPGLAHEWDVIMIRRSWHFDTAIRLQ
ncbi:MAG TPA: TonB C-terminal domain-containing protein [Dehalococcoidia bacterium]|nr:TonB C-terminal domain-containing protein [Dehalococcoidia bacterium]